MPLLQPSGVFHISIHAPREGGDAIGLDAGLPLFKFQSTPPARGATARGGYTNIWMHISIHAPREGGDPEVSIRMLDDDA